MKKNNDYFEDFCNYERKQKYIRIIVGVFFTLICLSVIHFFWFSKNEAADFEFDAFLRNSNIDSNKNFSDKKSSEIEYIPDDFDYYGNNGRIGYSSIKGGVPAGMPVNGWISSRFGYRRTVFSKSNFFHKGVDIRAPYGTKIYSTAAGVVEEAGFKGSYGFCVKINHNNNFKTVYAHCSELTVKKNQFVQRGQLIGYVGSTGASTGTHLHYEVIKNGNNLDPERFFGYDNKSWRLAGK